MTGESATVTATAQEVLDAIDWLDMASTGTFGPLVEQWTRDLAQSFDLADELFALFVAYDGSRDASRALERRTDELVLRGYEHEAVRVAITEDETAPAGLRDVMEHSAILVQLLALLRQTKQAVDTMYVVRGLA
jgi:hypothetical protein